MTELATPAQKTDLDSDGLERGVVQQSSFALIERVLEMEEEGAAQVDELA